MQKQITENPVFGELGGRHSMTPIVSQDLCLFKRQCHGLERLRGATHLAELKDYLAVSSESAQDASLQPRHERRTTELCKDSGPIYIERAQQRGRCRQGDSLGMGLSR
jgi:hypothetical protein